MGVVGYGYMSSSGGIENCNWRLPHRNVYSTLDWIVSCCVCKCKEMSCINKVLLASSPNNTFLLYVHNLMSRGVEIAWVFSYP